MTDNNFKNFINEIYKSIPKERVFTDALKTFAYGTDASFYKLKPKAVIKVQDESEVVDVINLCNKYNIPVTFRASGTSLSGQSITDSILLVSDRVWNKISVSADGSKITVQPSTLGGHANAYLKRFNKKIGPDPASINSASVCGIASNNASGMTSGVKFNSYNTLVNMRIVFANGSFLDTSDEESKNNFLENNREMIVDLLSIANEINSNVDHLSKINSKYQIKNTMGYSINSLVDFQDPIEIIKHLMIGSEGTLGFISEITFNTVDSLPNKASALIFFPDIHTASSAIPILQKLPVDAAEIMDRAALKSVEDKPGMPEYIKEFNNDVSALLIETSARNENLLNENINRIKNKLSSIRTVKPVEFISDPKGYLKLWKVRKGLFPSVSKSRQPGTTIIIEDLNFHTAELASAISDLQKLFKEFDYDDAIIWGHALSGNIHFVFAQDFNNPREVIRYKRFMDEVVFLVIDKYNGSLKAEHGTGRNMAPFVKYEWGSELYDFMVRIKQTFDPKGILNPGVLINTDPSVNVKNLKPTPIVSPIIDKCIECGFCESICPSKNLTLTPRQRIAVWREAHNKNNIDLKKELTKQFDYYGEKTCATDGLCQLNCPVDIDTGLLIKSIRAKNNRNFQKRIVLFISDNFSFTTHLLKTALKVSESLTNLSGEDNFFKITKAIRKITFNKLPAWNKALPTKSYSKFENTKFEKGKKVIYFPSCISRNMGLYRNSIYKNEQTKAMLNILHKAGYSVIFPENLNNLCCGMPFASKGFNEVAVSKSNQLLESIIKVNPDKDLPIVFDTSPCVQHFNKFLESVKGGIKVYDSVEFIADYVLPELNIKPKEDSIAVHITCSSEKMELNEKIIKVAEACAKKVYIPEDISCCGFAGDRGFSYPELNQSALDGLDEKVKAHNCSSGYSNSRTCEIGLTLHSGIEYNSIAQLVDKCIEE